MRDTFRTVREISEQWGVTERAVRHMCAQGRIDGAEKIGRDWLIPADVSRPEDGRITNGNYLNWRSDVN